MTSPRAREIPADVKAKVKKVLSGHASGVKAADFPREWEKVRGIRVRGSGRRWRYGAMLLYEKMGLCGRCGWRRVQPAPRLAVPQAKEIADAILSLH